LRFTVDGKCSECKKALLRDNYLRNKDKRLQSMKEYRRRVGPEKISELNRAYRERHRDVLLEADRLRYQTKREEILAYHASEEAKRVRSKTRRQKWASDENYRLHQVLRNRTNRALRLKSYKKSAPVLELLGCPLDVARRHIEAQFAEGMSWENSSEWHIDHIRPCASFDLSDPVQQRECFHYSNLQPLWAQENLRKGAKLAA
jgi:hypothetical protein